jgi:CheY-like chemotaxis protein
VNRKTARKIAKVLVVEDHREFLQFLELALTRRGWEVITSASGREALDKLEHTTPSLILLDMWMPGMDGFELAQFLKTSPRYRDIPILAVTGLLSWQNRKLCLDAGCDDYLTKPFALQDLEDHMNRLLGGQTACLNKGELRTNVKKTWPT